MVMMMMMACGGCPYVCVLCELRVPVCAQPEKMVYQWFILRNGGGSGIRSYYYYYYYYNQLSQLTKSENPFSRVARRA